MKVARVNQTQADRRCVVLELLAFIRDFNHLDTTQLILRAQADFEFVEACEAVLQSAVGPWRSVDALRDFCVQALTGFPPTTIEFMERVRPRHRVSPFSIPFELLQAVMPHRGQFDAHRLRTLAYNSENQLRTGTSSVEAGYQVPCDQWWLVTTAWARVITTVPLNSSTRVEFHDLGANRTLHFGLLQALVEEPMPCLWQLAPNGFCRTIIHSNAHEPTTVILAIEGWIYES